jgi:hypothetical protein
MLLANPLDKTVGKGALPTALAHAVGEDFFPDS